MSLQPLPIDAALPSIIENLKKNSNAIIEAEPGAGKTTRLPPALLDLTNKAVWVLEPRRIAAIAASRRIAEERNWEWGNEVGYQVRFENRTRTNTRLIFLTEALLLRKMVQDPELKNVGCIVLDEFHERNIHSDLAISALRELQQLSRPDLKIIVMSATLDSQTLSDFLETKNISVVPGKIFPVTVINDKRALLLRTDFSFIEKMESIIRQAVKENTGDILCFLPGRGEIERLRTQASSWAATQNISILPLHGQLDIQDQKAALNPLPGKRRIILATNVAESSLTVPGVSIVIDSGLARISEIHPRTGLPSLQIRRISKASATQRAGRAARLGPGIVYRAWPKSEDTSFPEFDIPEIQRSDLSESLLLLAALGIRRPENFSWFEPPSTKALKQAQEFLSDIGALNEDGSLTTLGENIRKIPLSPRLAMLLLCGRARGSINLAAELATLLNEPGGRKDGSHANENDLWQKLVDWRQSRNSQWLDRSRDQLLSCMNTAEVSISHFGQANSDIDQEICALLFSVFPDRLCRRRRPGDPQAKMVGGRGVKLHPESSVKNSEYFLALEVGEGREVAETMIYSAIGIPEEFIVTELQSKTKKNCTIEWDDSSKKFWADEFYSWHDLPIGKIHRRPAKPEEIAGQLANIALENWDLILQKNIALNNWIARWKYWNNAKGITESTNKEWLEPILSQACYGENSLEKVWSKDLVVYFQQSLSESVRQQFSQDCPAYWRAPSESMIPIQYNSEQGLLIEIRLQEIFGLATSPQICGQSLTFALLAPNYRPVQVTRDLASFWKNAYPEVRKEMRSRYPKHSWPEDPLTAPAQAKGRKGQINPNTRQ